MAARKSAPDVVSIREASIAGDDAADLHGYELLRTLPDGKLRAALWYSDMTIPPVSDRPQVRFERERALWLQGETRPDISGGPDEALIHLLADSDDDDTYRPRRMWFPDRLLPASDLAVTPWNVFREDAFHSDHDLGELNEPDYDWWTDMLPFWKSYPVYP